MTIDEYVAAVMSVKEPVCHEDKIHYEKLYYGTFPGMQCNELPELKVFNTHDMCTRLLYINLKPYLVFDDNMFRYIQLSTYSFFSDESRENYQSLFYAIRSDYLYSRRKTTEAQTVKNDMQRYPFTLPEYSVEEKRILHNINYVSFPLQCFHEMAHCFFVGELQKEEIKALVNNALQKEEDCFCSTHKSHSVLTVDSHLREEIFCDCDALYAILYLFSNFKDTISPKDIVDSAILNLIGIALIQEAKNIGGNSYYKRIYLRISVLSHFIKIIMNLGIIPDDSYEDVDAICKYFFEEIYPIILNTKNSLDANTQEE